MLATPLALRRRHPQSLINQQSHVRKHEEFNMKSKHPTGYLIYEGPSALDPSVNIAVIVNRVRGDATNEKTGSMAQSFILRTDMPPNVALKTKQDHAICGACPYAGGNGCYVSIKMVCSVYSAYKRGSYVKTTPEDLAVILAANVKSKRLAGFRAGSYGDPAAAPFEVWEPIVMAVRAESGKTSGYTHQWSERYAYMGRTADPRFRALVMASAHGPVDTILAQADEWRPFTVFGTAEELQGSGLAMCPASKEAGYRKSCATCGNQSACNGRKGINDRRVGVGIVVHGNPVTVRQAKRAAEKLEVT